MVLLVHKRDLSQQEDFGGQVLLFLQDGQTEGICMAGHAFYTPALSRFLLSACRFHFSPRED
jgi:hypothetical protein